MERLRSAFVQDQAFVAVVTQRPEWIKRDNGFFASILHNHPLARGAIIISDNFLIEIITFIYKVCFLVL